MRAKTVLPKDSVGRYGEDVAARHLVGLGYRLLARNWRCPVGEIDIVATDGSTLVICEVKTRRSTAYGLPVEAVNERKQAKLRELALHWLHAHPGGGVDVRFDVVGVVQPKAGAPVVSLLRGAF